MTFRKFSISCWVKLSYGIFRELAYKSYVPKDSVVRTYYFVCENDYKKKKKRKKKDVKAFPFRKQRWTVL